MYLGQLSINDKHTRGVILLTNRDELGDVFFFDNPSAVA
jgi:hypothetical protein